MRVRLVLAFLVALSPFTVSSSSAQTRNKELRPPASSQSAEREKANENVLMLLGGTAGGGGPWVQMAQDVATVLTDGDNLRVLPVAGGGAKVNIRDVLLLRGIDLGITRLEMLNDSKTSGEFGPHLDRRLTYIAALSVDMLQLLVRPEIKSLKDLHGKKVMVLPKESVIPRILKTLDVDVNPVFVSFPDAIEQMRTGQIYAAACTCSVPIPAYRAVSPDLNFKLLDIPYVEALEGSFLPASISSETYPNLMGKDAKVQTIGSNVALISYNWVPGSERYRKIEKFVDAFFSSFDKLRQPPRHPSWRDVNLSASLPGWQRFPAAQQWLDRQAAEAKAAQDGIDAQKARAQAAKAAPGDAAEQERLYKEFIEWSSKRPKR
jgi:TRAP-type uncharacterized transport system substrate-binding protein